MRVKFKKLHKDAVMPSYAKPGDAGMDLTAVTDGVLKVSDGSEPGYYYVEYDIGLAVEIPEGHVGLLFPRSSVSKKDLSLANSIGVVDSGYRDSIKLRFKIDGMSFLTKCGPAALNEDRMKKLNLFAKGDRVGQLVILPFPTIEPVETRRLSQTARGRGGFGSTGR